MIEKDDILAAFSLTRAEMASLQTMREAEDQARAERDHFTNVYLPERMAGIAAELTELLPGDATLVFTYESIL